MKILLAEDDFINRLTVERMLEKQGHTVVPASNGREAVKALADSSIDLVLMDISMPEMDGLEATTRIRSGNSEASDPHIPIIAMTAHAMPEDRNAYREAGMDGFVEKPVDMNELLDKVASIPEAVLNRDNSAPVAAGNTASGAGGNAETDILDRAWLMKRYEDDEELVAEVYQIFTEDAPMRLSELQEALGSDNPEAAVKAVHALKGMSATIGARTLSEIAAETEVLGRKGLMDDFRNNVPRLIEAVDSVMDRIRA